MAIDFILLIFFALVPAMIGSVVARYASIPVLGWRLDWPSSILISAAPMLFSWMALVAFSYKAPDSTLFTLLPFLVYFAAVAAFVRLFVKKEGLRASIGESLLLAFAQSTGTLLAMAALSIAALVIYWAYASTWHQ